MLAAAVAPMWLRGSGRIWKPAHERLDLEKIAGLVYEIKRAREFNSCGSLTRTIYCGLSPIEIQKLFGL